jgi:hypothetical protein
MSAVNLASMPVTLISMTWCPESDFENSNDFRKKMIENVRSEDY